MDCKLFGLQMGLRRKRGNIMKDQGKDYGLTGTKTGVKKTGCF